MTTLHNYKIYEVYGDDLEEMGTAINLPSPAMMSVEEVLSGLAQIDKDYSINESVNFEIRAFSSSKFSVGKMSPIGGGYVEYIPEYEFHKIN